MTDLATLSLKVDSTDVKRGVGELDHLTAAGTRAEGAVDRLGDEAAQSGKQMRGAAAGASELAREAQRAAQASTGYAAGAGKAGSSSRLASHHVQNLAFQAQDLFIGLQAGQRPMTVFLQQGSQIAGVMGQAGIGVGGLAKAVGGMVVSFAKAHPILLGVAAAAGVAYGAFKLFQSEVAKSGELQEYANGLGLTKKEMEELEGVGVTASDVFTGLYRTLDDYLGLSDVFSSVKAFAVDAFKTALDWGTKAAAGIYAGWVGGFDAIVAVWKNLPDIIGEGAIAAANLTLSALETMVNKAIALLNAPIQAVNSMLQQAGLGGIDEIGQVSIGRFDNPFAGTSARTATEVQGAFSNRYNEAQGALGQFGSDLRGNIMGAAQDRLSAQADEIIADRSDKAAKAAKVKKTALDELTKTTENALKSAQDYAEGLAGEAARIGKSAIEIKKMEASANAAAAEQAAAKAPTEALRDALLDQAQAIRDNYAEWENLTRAQADADFQNNVIKPLDDEYKLLGLVGPARELAALALEEEAFKARAVKNGLTDVNAAWEEYLAKRTRNINADSALERDAEAARMLNDELRNMVGLLDSMGGVARGIGSALGIVTGNYQGIGGSLGQLLNTTTGTRVDERTGEVVASKIGDEMAKIFKTDGIFGRAMESALQGAGIGAALGQSLGGKTGSDIGAAIGAIAGSEFMGAISGPLAAASAVNQVIGDIFGFEGGPLGIFTSLFSKTPWGRATVSQNGVAEAGGNSGASQRAALSTGDSIFGALTDIADAFGGSVGDFGSIAVGVRHGDYRVNTTGRSSLKKKKGAVDFDGDAEAAIAYAIQVAIERGAIDGIREGTQALLRATDDLQTNLENALQFEGVFKELQSYTDPLGYALENLANEFDKLLDIFDMAGATAEEYAQLQELLTIKQAEAVEQARQDAVNDLADRNSLEVDLLRLLGREEEALSLARMQELAATKEADQALQGMIYQLQDANSVIETFEPLADSLRSYRDTLFGNQDGAAGLAFSQAQFRDTASLAGQGDATALAGLQSDAEAYLSDALANASTATDYNRALGEVLAAVDSGIFAADTQVDYAKAQIEAVQAVSSELIQTRQQLAAIMSQSLENQTQLRRIWERFEGDGLTVKTDEDTPVYVATAPGFTVETA